MEFKVRGYVVYLLKNENNDKSYIGITQNFQKRKKQHFDIDKQKNKRIKDDMKKGHSFSMTIIEDGLNNRHEAEIREYYLIKEYDALSGYNQTNSFIPTEVVESVTFDLLNNLSLSYQAIADKFNLSKGTIYNINKGYIIEFEDIEYPIRINSATSIKTTNQLKSVIVDLSEDRLNISQIAERNSVSEQVIHFINQNAGNKVKKDVIEIASELNLEIPFNKRFVKQGIKFNN